MSRVVRVCVIAGYGINADLELVEAFQAVGGGAERVHFTDLAADTRRLNRYDILAFPGGFSFGDHLGSGLVFAARFNHALGDEFRAFRSRGGLVIGICNGFQILVKMGVLPDLSATGTPEVTLIHNESGVFEDSWVSVTFDSMSPCIWTRGLSDMEVPIRHGEGRFIAQDDRLLDEIESRHLAAVRYRDRNPNGSSRNIAGICDSDGRILGLMPHPEAFLHPENHPRWTRERIVRADGLQILENGIKEAKIG